MLRLNNLNLFFADSKVIPQNRLGHEYIKTMLCTYGHLYPNTNREVANKLNNVLKFDKLVVEQRTKVSNQFMNARKYKSDIIEDE